jgi:hypothetical protein
MILYYIICIITIKEINYYNVHYFKINIVISVKNYL